MPKIGNFIYPWGNGHYSRMMRLNNEVIAAVENACTNAMTAFLNIQREFTRSAKVNSGLKR